MTPCPQSDSPTPSSEFADKLKAMTGETLGAVCSSPRSSSPSPTATATPFDPLRDAAEHRIKLLNRPDGSKEFILPALRNLGLKLVASFFWLLATATFTLGAFALTNAANELSPWIRWFFVDNALYHVGLLGLIVLAMTVVCLDVWLRSSTIIAKPGELQVVTHWLVFKRARCIPTGRIIETRIEGGASIEIISDDGTPPRTTQYYKIVVLTVGAKAGWLARHFPDESNDNDAKVFNSGGKSVSAATGIEGEEEAKWLLSQLRAALGIAL